ncbi:unnamed protein product [Auanema sp. JU1783]|nr:unnamed protein product [Auanema sp. JU1783]
MSYVTYLLVFICLDAFVISIVTCLALRMIFRRVHDVKVDLILMLPFCFSDFCFCFTGLLYYFRRMNYYQITVNEVIEITHMECALDGIVILQVFGVWTVVWSLFVASLCSTIVLIFPQLFLIQKSYKLILYSALALLILPTVTVVIETVLTVRVRHVEIMMDVMCSRRDVLGEDLYTKIKVIRWVLLIISFIIVSFCMIYIRKAANENNPRFKNADNLVHIRKGVFLSGYLVIVNSIVFVFADINRYFAGTGTLDNLANLVLISRGVVNFLVICYNYSTFHSMIFMESTMNMSVITRLLIYNVLSFMFAILDIGLVAVILLKRKNPGMALGDITYSIGFFLFTCRRLEYFSITVSLDLVISRSECVKNAAPILLFVGSILVGNMNIINAIDRFLATFSPIWYYQRTTRYTITLLSISFAAAILFLCTDILLVLTSPTRSIEQVNIYCGFVEFVYPEARNFFVYYQYSCVLLAGLVYIAIGFSLNKRLKRANQLTVLSKQNSKKLIRSNTTMSLIMLNTVLFLLIPQILIDASFVTTDIRTALYVVILFKTGFNFLIFVSRHRELRSFIIGTKPSMNT